MVRVIFLWFGERAGGHQTKYETMMPQVPSVGDTVHVPVNGVEGDPDDRIAMNVHRRAWANDQPADLGGWHAEVQLR